MARVKNNNEYRTKVGNLMRNALENNPNNKKMLDYSNTLELVKSKDKGIPYFFNEVAKPIVQRAYPKEHCNTLKYFKGLYGSPCDVVADDKCYYFAYTDEDSIDENGEPTKIKNILILD